MKTLDPNKHMMGLNGKKLSGAPLVVGEQLCNLAMLDRGAAASTGKEAYHLNELMQRIATAKKPINLITGEVKLLRKVLDNAIASKQISTFLVGRLYEELEGDGK